MACQSESFLGWRYGPFTPLQGTYDKRQIQTPLGVVICDDRADDFWKPGAQ